jgi:hypothetical protein
MEVRTSAISAILTEMEASLAEKNLSLAEEVFSIVKERARTRSAIEKRQQLIQLLGIVSALVVAIAFGYWSYLLLSSGFIIGGSILGTADLAALVTAFIVGGRPQ